MDAPVHPFSGRKFSPRTREFRACLARGNNSTGKHVQNARADALWILQKRFSFAASVAAASRDISRRNYNSPPIPKKGGAGTEEEGVAGWKAT